MPDPVYLNMGITFAGRHRVGKYERTARFVIAIDVSGSVREERMEKFLGEVKRLLIRYEVSCEVVYWSGKVGDSLILSSANELTRIEPVSTQNTDVRCLFNYLSGKEMSLTEKKEPLKVKDIRAVFVLTDGRFEENYGMYKEAFWHKTIWLIDGEPAAFTPPFGRVIGMERRE